MGRPNPLNVEMGYAPVSESRRSRFRFNLGRFFKRHFRVRRRT